MLNDEEVLIYLENKLQEEMQEYLEDKSIEELADLIEVIYALCNERGYSKEELENVRKNKNARNGAFEKRICLEYVED